MKDNERPFTCPLCEASCGLLVQIEAGRPTAIRGDGADPLSKGYLCPKGVALLDLQADPDWLQAPLRREGDRWVEVSWEAALDEGKGDSAA